MIQALPPLTPSQSLAILGRGPREEQRKVDSDLSMSGKNKATSAFLTQLLASKHGAAAYRQKRRCNPLEARSAYLATKTLQTASNSLAHINLHI